MTFFLLSTNRTKCGLAECTVWHLILALLPHTCHSLLALKMCWFPWLIWAFPIKERKSDVLFLWRLILYFLGSRCEFPVPLVPVWGLYQYHHMASGISFQWKKLIFVNLYVVLQISWFKIPMHIAFSTTKLWIWKQILNDTVTHFEILQFPWFWVFISLYVMKKFQKHLSLNKIPSMVIYVIQGYF